ncbi:MAG: hypothetical protein WB505_00020, partial [Pseudolabrys sp.]
RHQWPQRIEGSHTQLRLGPGLVAAFIVMVVNRPHFHSVLTIRNGLRGSGSFIGSAQGSIKVDGTFV